MTDPTATELDLSGIRRDIEAHRAELPAHVVDCVGCHIAVTDVPALLDELLRLRPVVEAAKAWRLEREKPGGGSGPYHRAGNVLAATVAALEAVTEVKP